MVMAVAAAWGSGDAKDAMRLVLERHRAALLAETPADAAALKFLAGAVDAEGKWPDVNYADPSPSNWKTTQHLGRVRSLARVVGDPQRPEYHDQAMIDATLRALDHWIAKKYRNPNWWHNDIGTPRQMLDIILLLGDRLTGERRAGALEILNQFGRPQARYAANTVWEARLGLEYGALTGDEAMVKKYAGMIADEITIGAGQGIQRDFSFYQHGPRLQQFSYGGAFIDDTSRLAQQLTGTPWGFPQEKIDLLASKILEGDQWMMRGMFTSPTTLDRQGSRPDSLRTRLSQRAARSLIEAGASRKQELAVFAERCDGKAPPLNGFRAFPRSDFAAFQRPHFAAFVKTSSLRTRTSEIGLNGENLLGHLMGCGDHYLLRSGDEYQNLQPVWDWELLPGVTWAKGAGELQRQAFVGAVGDGSSGVVVMDYRFGEKAEAGKAEKPATLSARKLWAFHGDMMLCLIGDLQGAGAQTALDQCRLNGDVSIVTSSGTVEQLHESQMAARPLKAIYHNGFAYLPLGGEKVRISAGEVSGNWHRVSRTASAQPVTAKVFLAVMEHASLAGGFVVADVGGAAAAAELAAHPTWEILRNDHAAQAVKFSDGTVMAAFYEAARAGDIEVDAPCVMLLHDGRIYAADPRQKGGNLGVSIANNVVKLQLPADGTTVTAP